jgi:hypothetical protein
MHTNDLKKITVVSMAGTGNIFCQTLIKYNLKASLGWVDHDIDRADKNGINIFILRDPYKTVESGLELQFDTYTQDVKNLFHREPKFVDNKIRAITEMYIKMMDHSKKFDYIYPVTFEFLTENSEKFLDYVSKKFEIPYLDTRVSAEEVIHKISLKKDLYNRVPRDKSDLRKKIDYCVKHNDALVEPYKQYIEYRDILQSTENMI